jgi:hypothetical protein
MCKVSVYAPNLKTHTYVQLPSWVHDSHHHSPFVLTPFSPPLFQIPLPHPNAGGQGQEQEQGRSPGVCLS